MTAPVRVRPLSPSTFLCQAKVRNPWLVESVEQYIGGFQVAMDDTFAMGSAEVVKGRHELGKYTTVEKAHEVFAIP